MGYSGLTDVDKSACCLHGYRLDGELVGRVVAQFAEDVLERLSQILFHVESLLYGLDSVHDSGMRFLK